MSAKSWRLIAKWATRLLLLAVLAMITTSVVILTILPRATHGAALDVLSGSMTPGIPVGSIVLDRPVDPGTLHVGDIATYAVPGEHRFITHRIVKIDTSKSPNTFTFKGDANRGPDTTPIPADAIRGKMWFHVPYLGTIRDALHTKGGLAGVAMLALTGYALYQGASGLRDRRRPPATVDADNLVIDLDRARPQFSLLMRLRRDSFDGLEPEAVARVLGAVLVASDDDTFTLLAAHADRARDALELIDALTPVKPEPPTTEPKLSFEPDWNPFVADHLGVLVAI